MHSLQKPSKIEISPVEGKAIFGEAQMNNPDAKILTSYQTTRPEITYAQSAKRNENLNKSPQDDNAPQSNNKSNEMSEITDMLKQIMQQMITLTNLLLTLTTKISQNSIP